MQLSRAAHERWAHYLLSGDEDWNGLSQPCSALCQSVWLLHMKPHNLCVWWENKSYREGEPTPRRPLLEPALRRFAVAAGLAFVELALASTSEGICVTLIEPRPHFERFGDAAPKQIVEGIVRLLTAKVDVIAKARHRPPEESIVILVCGGLADSEPNWYVHACGLRLSLPAA